MSEIGSFLLVVLTCAAGGVGAALRWWCDSTVQRIVGATYPWGTLVVNVLGSFLLGVVVALADDSAAVLQLLGFGVLGGYTTFSSSVLQSIRTAGAEGVRAGITHAVGTALLCLFAALFGLQVG